jgi:succinate dehydrogenase / fumarate reductase iron-sulfur subunit
MRVQLRIWRQDGPHTPGRLVRYGVDDVHPEMSFLEMLDVLNEDLIAHGEPAIAFDHDCREGICGACSMVINGIPHGPGSGTTTCQLYMRDFGDIREIVVEPWRARAFPVIRDLVVERAALDRIIEAGGYVSINAGAAPDAHTHPIAKQDAELAFEAASCIGCGACVAACPNASAMLFVAAKVSHLALLPQGHPERVGRALDMVEAMDREGFGNCANHYECEAVCPKEISVRYIARLNREFLHGALTSGEFARPRQTRQYEE